MSGIRVSISSVPSRPTPCGITEKCVYRDANGVCDDPRTNKGNGDAYCHRKNNKDVVAILVPASN